MDIAKIRKKALLKDDGEKAVEKHGTAPAEKEQQKTITEQETDRELAVSQADVLPEKTAEKKEVQAVPPVPEDSADDHDKDTVELLTFSLSHEEYAFRVSEVEEVLRFQKIARVPTMPDYVLGITSLRGKIIPVIDLKTRLNLRKMSSGSSPSGERTEHEQKAAAEKKILIIDGPKGLIGAAIDSVKGVVRLPRSAVLQPPGNLDENELRFIEGIVVLKKRFISIIHADAAIDIQVV
jgi:purine-binding chemotaxis protein CheW